MPRLPRPGAPVFALGLVIGIVALGPAAPAAPPSLVEGVGELWVHRNLGAAYFDAGRFADALRELSQAAALSPTDAGDARNEGIAALLAGDRDAARLALHAAQEIDAADARIAYALGIAEMRTGHAPEAIAALTRCRQLGGSGPELEYNLALLDLRIGDEDAARTELAAVVARGPSRAPRHFAPALLRQAHLLLTAGERANAAQALRRLRDVAPSLDRTPLPEEELQRGDLLALAAFPPPGDVRAAGTLPAFATSPLALGEIRWAHVGDVDGDGDADLLLGDGQTLHDLRQDGDAWLDVTASRGLAGLLGVSCAVALDVDHDGVEDLVRGGAGGLEFQPGARGAWDPPRPIGNEALTRFVALDADAEGDVDFATAGPRRPALLLNRGSGVFADVSESSGLAAIGPTVAVVAGDFDDDHDQDLVFLTRRGEIVVAANARDGHFDVRPPLAGAPSGGFEIAPGDLDGDGDLDLAVAAPRGVFVLENRGALEFSAPRDPVLPGTVRWPVAGARSLWIADLDCDGHPDLLAAAESGALLGLGAGAMEFTIAIEPMIPLSSCGAFPVEVGCIDAGASPDLVTSRGTCGIARNVGRTGAGLVLRLLGRRDNRDGVGALVELLSGSQYTRRECDGGPVPLGLGAATHVDALRVRWPDGILQDVPDAAPGREIVVEERIDPVGSGPLLHAWDGARFDFVTDILRGASLGRPIGTGRFAAPDAGEAVRIAPGGWAPDDAGHVTLQITEERREIAYVDQVRMYAVDHPDSVEVWPDGKPGLPELGVRVLDAARLPRLAVDGAGRDVTDRLVRIDDLVVGNLALTRVPGLCEPHTLELDFGAVSPDARLTLHLAGWRYGTTASANLGIAQDPGLEFVAPRLEVARADGSWSAWPHEIGFPGGDTRSIAVDLTGAFPGGEARLRLTTTMRLYWDRALLQVGDSPVVPTLTMVLPDHADLHWRGRSAPLPAISNEEPPRFDHGALRGEGIPWDPPTGGYTRYGDVTPLVTQPEDMYVILGSGDECTIRFPTDALPPLPAGWSRTYFVAGDGWTKDGDPATARSGTVDPLPFHAMSGYPYRADEAYPDDGAHREYRATWNTREAPRLTRDLAAAARAADPVPADAPVIAP